MVGRVRLVFRAGARAMRAYWRGKRVDAGWGVVAAGRGCNVGGAW